MIGTVFGKLENCNFYQNEIVCTSSNAGLIGVASNGLKDIDVVNSHVEASSGSYVGGLVGVAYGDLENISAISVTEANKDQYQKYADYTTDEGI